MRLALPLILQEDLATSRTLIASLANGESAAYQFGATEVLRSTVEDRQGRISIEATFTDMSTQRNHAVIRVDAASSAGLLSVGNALAKKIDEHAVDFSTKNSRVLQAFTAAAESASSEGRVQMLDEAISNDPGFGLGYITLAETVARSREQNLAALLQTGANRSASFTPLDRVRFNALRGQLSHASLEEQENAQAAVLQLAPNNSDALVALGSDRFLQGDGTRGRELLGRALELSPGNANIRNQLALGLLETRRFADAEKIFAGLNNNVSVLPELAVCILLEGDEARANAIADKLANSVYSGDKQAYRATWFALSGHLDKAINAMQGFYDPAVGLAQTSVWQLMQKDFAGAKKNASSAMQLANRNIPVGVVGMLLSEGDRLPEQWRDKVDAAALNDQAKQAILGYGFFLYGHYSEAADVWRKALQESGGADLRARAMLASSLDHAGRSGEARKILVQPFVPEFGDLYAAISFREMRRMLQ